MTNPQSSKYISVLLTIITTIVVIGAIRLSLDIIVPFLMAVFVAIIASRPVEWLQSKKVSASLAVFLVLSGFVLGMVIIALLLGSSIEQFAKGLHNYQAEFKQLLAGVADWFAKYGVNFSKSGLMSAIDPAKVLQIAEGLVGSVGKLFSKTIIIFITALFMMLDAWSFPEKIERMYGKKSAPILKTFNTAVKTTREYMSIRALMSLIMGVLIGIGLAVIGLEYAVMWGMLVFLLNFIPGIGLFLAAAPAVLFSLLQLGAAKTVLVLLVYFLVNGFVDLYVQPKFVGSKLGLSILAILLSIFFWGWVLGPIGMILGIPLTLMIKDAVLTNK